MTYPTISAKTADKAVQALHAGEQLDLDDFVVWKESDVSFSEQDAASLKVILTKIRARYPAKLKVKSRQASDFEAEASPAFHGAITEGSYCADPEFWIWLAVAHFAELITWRYGEKFAPANFGIGAASENFLFRLWLRAELVYDQERKDHYELARKGSSRSSQTIGPRQEQSARLLPEGRGGAIYNRVGGSIDCFVVHQKKNDT